MDLLLKELRATKKVLGEGRRLTQMHWGGGTPNWLPPELASELFEEIVGVYALNEAPELSIEIDPKTLRRNQLQQLRALGFNRVSFGIQDIEPRVQASVGRVFPEEEAADVLLEARELDFRSINVDLMYGLPGQTVASFRRTIDVVAAWRPERIALFGYAHVPRMRPHQRLLPEGQLPSPRERIQLFATAANLLGEYGYVHLGLDHFVLPTDDLAEARSSGLLYRNFQGYSIRYADDLLGLGLSAIGHIAGTFLVNHRQLRAYGHAIEKDGLATERTYTPTPEQRAIAQSINAVMCYGHLDLLQVSESFGGPEILYGHDIYEKLNNLREDGALVLEDDNIYVTPSGRYVLRHIAAALDPLLSSDKAKLQKFSNGL